ncbi:preprotein translocase subunit SecE [Luteimonas sp. BDR2-5]|uniref:preprotein translocase subunit SecE n=1 Tax=Proluteimonas luteida TaxID=2878685 RepID=UPI001E5141AB|nr:preprotein translocase subunit SecE [Luteimonas sp. BDR2-5]MCD9028966.1 preprotein translocase subunit SecE [Luteimonas sp. BDR2-5]
MNSRVEQSKSASSADLARYAAAVALVVVGVFAFYWFEAQLATPVRSIIVGLCVVGAAAVFLTTSKGHKTREFFSETRFEMRKVVWPTRQEAIRLTWVVIIAVIIISLLLAGFDKVIQFVIRLILRQ